LPALILVSPPAALWSSKDGDVLVEGMSVREEVLRTRELQKQGARVAKDSSLYELVCRRRNLCLEWAQCPSRLTCPRNAVSGDSSDVSRRRNRDPPLGFTTWPVPLGVVRL